MHACASAAPTTASVSPLALPHAACSPCLRAGRIEISAQNHNFAVDPASLPADVEVSHINLNDGTCAGLVVPSKKVMTIQVS